MSNSHSYYIILLEEKGFNYIQSRQKIKSIYTTLREDCVEFESHNDEFIVIASRLSLNQLSEKLKDINCKVHAIGENTGVAIASPELN